MIPFHILCHDCSQACTSLALLGPAHPPPLSLGSTHNAAPPVLNSTIARRRGGLLTLCRRAAHFTLALSPAHPGACLCLLYVAAACPAQALATPVLHCLQWPPLTSAALPPILLSWHSFPPAFCAFPLYSLCMQHACLLSCHPSFPSTALSIMWTALGSFPLLQSFGLPSYYGSLPPLGAATVLRALPLPTKYTHHYATRLPLRAVCLHYAVHLPVLPAPRHHHSSLYYLAFSNNKRFWTGFLVPI